MKRRLRRGATPGGDLDSEPLPQETALSRCAAAGMVAVAEFVWCREKHHVQAYRDGARRGQPPRTVLRPPRRRPPFRSPAQLAGSHRSHTRQSSGSWD